MVAVLLLAGCSGVLPGADAGGTDTTTIDTTQQSGSNQASPDDDDSDQTTATDQHSSDTAATQGSGADSTQSYERVYNGDVFDAELKGKIVAGERVTMRVTHSDGGPVEGATISINNNKIGTTNADGTITFDVPAQGDKIEIQIAKSGTETEFEQPVQ